MLLRHKLREGEDAGESFSLRVLPTHQQMAPRVAFKMQAAQTNLSKFTINKEKDMNGVWKGMYYRKPKESQKREMEGRYMIKMH